MHEGRLHHEGSVWIATPGGTARGILRRVPLAPAEQEKIMRYVYRCTRCGTGRLATMVELRGQDSAVHVFLCNRCRYASRPDVSLAVEEGEGALPVNAHTAIVPVARITGSGVEALRMEEI